MKGKKICRRFDITKFNAPGSRILATVAFFKLTAFNFIHNAENVSRLKRKKREREREYNNKVHAVLFHFRHAKILSKIKSALSAHGLTAELRHREFIA